MKPDFDTFWALQTLYGDYAATLDAGDFERWPDFFTDQCVYRLQSRENHERGLPLCTLSFESRGMLVDRVYGVEDTIYHDPYHQRHIVGAPRITAMGADGIRSLCAGRNYAQVPSDGTRQASGGGAISPKVDRRTGHSFGVQVHWWLHFRRPPWGSSATLVAPPSTG